MDDALARHLYAVAVGTDRRLSARVIDRWWLSIVGELRLARTTPAKRVSPMTPMSLAT